MKKNVLIVDDDEEMCEELSEVLSDEGYHVDFIHDGRKGRDRIVEGNYDIVLLDIKLPGLTGYDILKSTRTDNPIKSKIFVLTGRPLSKEPGRTQNPVEIDEENTLKLADGVINKPFDIASVLNTIKRSTILN